MLQRSWLISYIFPNQDLSYMKRISKESRKNDRIKEVGAKIL